MKLIDANLLIRYLINDNEIQAAAAEKLLKTSKEAVIVTDLTVAEVVWVLTSLYKIPKKDVISKMEGLLRIEIIAANRLLIRKALIFYGLYNISFIDAYLAAYCDEENLGGIYSYDKALDKIKSIKRFEPPSGS